MLLLLGGMLGQQFIPIFHWVQGVAHMSTGLMEGESLGASRALPSGFDVASIRLVKSTILRADFVRRRRNCKDHERIESRAFGSPVFPTSSFQLRFPVLVRRIQRPWLQGFILHALEDFAV